MNKNQFSRNELAFGKEVTNHLQHKKIAVIGAGGVGGMAIECLVRMGIEHLYICDFDTVDITNLNRQIFTSLEVVGESKVEAVKKRVETINPNCHVTIQSEMFTKETSSKLLNWQPDFILDCADTISYKIELIEFSKTYNIPFITSLGMANKFEPEKVTITDLSKTEYDPIAKIMRKQVKDRHIKGKIPVVFSPEIPQKVEREEEDVKEGIRKQTMPLASNVFVPNTAGLLAAHYVVKELMREVE